MGSFPLADERGGNCDRVGLVGRSVHHLRLPWTGLQPERDRRSSLCRSSAAGGICPSSRFVALRSWPSSNVNLLG